MPRSKDNKIQRVVLSLPFLAILTGLVVLVGISAWNMHQASKKTQETVERLSEEKYELEARERQLSDTTANLSTQRGIEEEIREKFSVAKEGERVIVLVDDPEGNATSTEEGGGWWRALADFLWPFN